MQQILLFPLNFSVPPPLKVAGPDAILAAQFGRRKLTGFEHPVNDLPGGLQDVGEVGNGQKRTVLLPFFKVLLSIQVFAIGKLTF